MLKKTLKTLNETAELLKKIGNCHDACIKRICFTKKRSLEKESGDLVYPFNRVEDFILCDIQMELLHSNYIGAKNDQVVMLHFKNVTDFKFFQEKSCDYANIYKVECSAGDNSGLTFKFYSTKKQVESLVLSCLEMVFCEK